MLMSERTVESRSTKKQIQCVVHKEMNDIPILSCPIGRGSWDPKSAGLIRLDALYEYAAATGDMAEAQRIGNAIYRLIDYL